jgi:hypothetical protein
MILAFEKVSKALFYSAMFETVYKRLALHRVKINA